MSVSRNLLLQLRGGGSDEMVQQQRDSLFIIDHQDRVRGAQGLSHGYPYMRTCVVQRCAFCPIDFM